MIPHIHGEPIRFGVDGSKGLIHDPVTGGVKVAEVAEVGEESLLVHDAFNPGPDHRARHLRLTDTGYSHRAPDRHLPASRAPTYDDQARAQAVAAAGAMETGDWRERAVGRVDHGSDTWTVV
ncbi:MAG: hypothetical protein R2734_03120 [Nocardioides sp.]